MTTRKPCTVGEAALAHRDNGRRLMAAALECFDDGLREAGEALRELSRLEYQRALALLADSLAA